MLNAWAAAFKHPDHTDQTWKKIRGIPDDSIVARPNTYLGHNFWYHKELKPSNVKNSNFLMKTGGLTKWHEKSRAAQVARILTNHFPSGEFRRRFNKEGPHKCVCGLGTHDDTRDHQLFKCPYWIRIQKHSHKPFIGPFGWRQKNMATYYSRFQRNWKPSDIVDFVKINPLVGTFTWSEILTKVKDDLLNDRPYSYNVARLTAHTSWRQAKWEEMMKKHFRRFGAEEFSMNHKVVQDWVDNMHDRAERFAQELYDTWTDNPDLPSRPVAEALEEWINKYIEMTNEEISENGEDSVAGEEEGEITPPPTPQIVALLDLAVADVADQSQLLDAELKEALYRDRNLYLPANNALALGGTPPPGG